MTTPSPKSGAANCEPTRSLLIERLRSHRTHFHIAVPEALDRYRRTSARGASFALRLLAVVFHLGFMVLVLPFWIVGIALERLFPDATSEEPDHLEVSEGGEEVSVLVEIWKQIVDVQQHFNDIEIKIRGFSVTIALAVVGAAGLVARERAALHWGEREISLGFAIAVAGAVGLFALWFMDRLWYHRLLYGAVNQGTIVENQLKRLGFPEAQLTRAIGEESYFRLLWRMGPKVRSKQKIDFFYGLLILCLLSVGIALAAGDITHRSEFAEAASDGQATSTEQVAPSRRGMPLDDPIMPARADGNDSAGRPAPPE